MPPRSPDRRQGHGSGSGVWRLMAALLQDWDVATDTEKQASSLWFSAITGSLLVELSSTGRAGKGKFQEVQPVADSAAAVSSSEAPPHGHGLSRAIDRAVVKLEELMIQEHVAWTKRPAGSKGGASAPSTSAACAEALMADTVRILTHCMVLHRPCPEDRPSGDLKAKMRAAVLQVVGCCTVAVEFRRPIEALQSGVFDIKLGSGAQLTIRVRLDAVRPAPSSLEKGCFGLRKNLGSRPTTCYGES